MKNLLLLVFILFGSCSLLADGDEILYLRTEDSYLPIYVRGNAQSDTYIMWVHGGPGSSGLYYGDIPEVAELHKKYRVVYWDQMSSGGSVGNPSSSAFTISNFATHVDGVAKIIKNRYNPKNFYILGHSWGGFLSGYYLVAQGNASLSAQRQSYFNGFINLNAVFDIQDTLTNGVDFVTNYANTQIAQNIDKDNWSKIISWYKEKNGVFLGADVTEHYCNVDKAGGMVIERDRRDQLTKELTYKMVFNSPFEFYSYYDNQKNIRTYLDIEKCSLVHEDKANVKAVTIPTLIMAGAMDKIAFLEDTERWHSMLKESKNPDDFPLIIYDNAAHAIFLDSKDLYITDIDNFIYKHNK